MSDEQLPQSQMSATGQAHAIADPAPPSATTELRTLEVSEGSQLEPDQPADLNDSESHNGQELNVEAPAPSDGGESRTPAPEEPGADVVGHVSPASLSPLAEATNTDEPELEELYAIAGWNYSAQEENEISFQAGDIVRIVLRANTDWWEGINMSRQPATVGYFPANRVRLVAGKPDAPWDAPSSEPSLDAGPATNADDETKETIATTGDLPAAGIKEGLLNRLGGLNVTQPDLQPEEAGASERKGNETQKAESEVSEESLPESGEKVVEIDAEVEAEDPTVSAESAENLEDESELLDADGNPLPSHWRKLWHEDQQAFYYFNTETEETTWDVPGSNGTIEAELLSQDGQERLDSITASVS